MRILKFVVSLLITLALIYLLDNRWVVSNQAIPPLGKFLDPFHGFWQNIESKKYKVPQAVVIPGLKEEVSVHFDSLMIPHIYAENDEDLYLTQGYVTAFHRLWQMEFQTHAAAGRVSEIIESEGALDYDRKQRRQGMAYGAENAIATMLNDPTVKIALTKYSDGVNAYINSLSYKDLPFEYKLLDYRPEPWTPEKMGLIFMNLSQTLNFKETDLEMTNALRLFGKEVFELLYVENDHPINDPVVENPGEWKFDAIAFDTIPAAVPQELIALPLSKDKKKGIGSNNWAVHGSRTASGAPLLCNDPHLTLSYPSIWYVVHLNTPTMNTMGASLAGAPMVILGFNDSIAWGCTNGQRDLVDWYSIKFKDNSYDDYLSDGQWRKTTKRVEVFKMRGREPFYDTVVYTHHGPVVYDRTYHSENQKNHYALKWLAHESSNVLKTIYLLNTGKNYDNYRDALQYWWGPAQNFAFASVQGDIAMQVQGKFPVRRPNEGRFVLDGSTTSTEWKAFIPFEQNVHIKNPPRGFVSSANQYPVDASYPYYIQASEYEAFRNRRINDVLSKKTSIKASDMMELQNDNYNLQAAESLPLMLSLLDVSSLKGEESRVAEKLTFWDFVSAPESIPASYYDAWWQAFTSLVFDEFDNANVPLDRPNEYSVIRLMKNNAADFPLWDMKNTSQVEDLAQLVKMAFSAAVKSVNEWEVKNEKAAKWADYKDTHIQHLLRLEPLSSHPRIGGDAGIVNAAAHRQGPSWRYIVSLEKQGVKAWGVFPAGQSGNPGSRFYDNLVQAWADGRYYRLNFQPNGDAMRERSLFTTVFIPD